MKAVFKSKNRKAAFYKRQTIRTYVCICLALMLLIASIPVNGMMAASAESETSATDAPVQRAAVEQTAEEEQHICTVLGFGGAHPGVAFRSIEVKNGASLRSVLKQLPETLPAVLTCEECSNKVEVSWECASYAADKAGEYRFDAKLDAERYIYAPLDDPETKDIDESKDKPYCELPYILVIVSEPETETSATDAKPAEAAPAPEAVTVSETDAAQDVKPADTPDAPVEEAKPVEKVEATEPDKDSEEAKPAESEPDEAQPAVASAADVPAEVKETVVEVDPAEVNVKEDGRLSAEVKLEEKYIPEQVSYVATLEKPVEYERMTPDAKVVLTESTVEKTLPDGKKITVSGTMPEGTELSVESVSHGYAEALLESTGREVGVVFAYDIKLVCGGAEYQPADFGKSVRVDISGLDVEVSEYFSIHHITENNMVETMQPEFADNAMSFTTTSFSTYVGSLTPVSDVIQIYTHRTSDTRASQYFYSESSLSNQIANSGGTVYNQLGALLNDLYDTMESTGTWYDVVVTDMDTYLSCSEETISGKRLYENGKSLTIKHNSDGDCINVYRDNANTTFEYLTIDANNHKNGNSQALIQISNSCSVTIGENVVLKGSGTSKDNRGINCNANCNLTINGPLLITDCKMSYGSAGISVGAGNKMTIKNCTIKNCQATGNNVSDNYGGGLQSKRDFELVDCVFENCKSVNGGAVYYGNSSVLTATNVDFISCSTDDSGGAIYADGKGSTFTGCTFTNCNSWDNSHNGGALYLSNPGTDTFDGCTFTGCVNKLGGAIYNAEGNILIKNGTVFDSCTSTSYGGAVYSPSASATVTVTDSIFKNCKAGSSGGSLMVDPDDSKLGTVVVTGTTFESNTAEGDGGGVYIQASNTTFSQNTVKSNTASMQGGGMYMTGGKATFSENIFEGNEANGTSPSAMYGGGALCIYKSDVTSSKDTFKGNTADDYGGAVHIESGSLAATDITVTGNQAINGGGIGNEGSLKLIGGLIDGNTALDSGGGICNNNYMTIDSATISNNVAEPDDANGYGGGIFLWDGQANIMGSTNIVGNKCYREGYGDGIAIYDHYGSSGIDPELRMTGSPYIPDYIMQSIINAVTNGANVDITVFDPFIPRSMITLAFRENSSYPATGDDIITVCTNGSSFEGSTLSTRDAQDYDIAKFAMYDPRYSLYKSGPGTSNPNGLSCQLWVKKNAAGVCYVDPTNGDDSNNGMTPEAPVKTMAEAYNKLAAYGGTIYLLDTYEPEGEVKLTRRSYTDDAGTSYTLTNEYYVSIRRYSKPDASPTPSGYGVDTFTGSLIKVNEGVELTLEDIIIDGHNRKLEGMEILGCNAPAVATADDAMIVVDGGTLNVEKLTTLKDAPVSSTGGALHVISGDVKINGGTINSSNDTSVKFSHNLGVGSAIYIDGPDLLNDDEAAKPAKVVVDGSVMLEDGTIMLGDPDAVLHMKDKDVVFSNGMDVVLPLSFGTNAADKQPGRILVAYDDDTEVTEAMRAMFEIENANKDVKNENVSIVLEKNTILIENDKLEFTLTAYPEDLTTSLKKTYTIDLVGDLGLKAADLAGKTIKVTELDAEKDKEDGFTALTAAATVDSQMYELGIADSKTTFGLTMAFGESSADLIASPSITIPDTFDPTADSTALVFKVHNANNLSTNYNGDDGSAAEVTFTLSVGTLTRQVVVHIDTAGITAISCTVPLKVAYVIDMMDTDAITPGADKYYIQNTCARPIQVDSVKFLWNSAKVANVFTAPEKLVASTESFGTSVSFTGIATAAETVEKLVAANATHDNTLGLKWNVKVGDGNMIKSSEDCADAAKIEYTIGLVE